MTTRRSAEKTGHLWIEPGESRFGPVAYVVLDAPVDQTFSYAVPPELEAALKPGQRVKVPVGRTGATRVGICISVDQREWDSTLRPLAALVDEPAILTSELLRLGEWIATYYGCPLGVTLSALVPAAARRGAGSRMVRFVTLTDVGRMSITALHAVRPLADALTNDTSKASRQEMYARLLSAVAEADGPVAEADLVTRLSFSRESIRTATKRRWLRGVRIRLPSPAPVFDLPRHEPSFELNADQSEAIGSIERDIAAGVFAVTVLHGVAGSGKTEVYIRAIRAAVARGGQAIMLVPEIMLTTQLVNRLASRFEGLAVLHSGLSDRDRSLLWHEIAAGRRSVIVGTRSAVFSPCPDLKLIVVDEEHESTYKNQRSPRYHARDVALKRAHLVGIPIILGSATPSLETWQNCKKLPNYRLVHLPHRVGQAVLPRVQIVDMDLETRERGSKVVLSRLLQQELTGTLARNEQAIILVNRRGYATWMFCPQCGLWLTCPNCSANLVFHQPQRKLWCHYCRYQTRVPERCPERNCGGRLVQRGCGTQRVEEFIKQQWPQARFQRVDSDTMKRRLDYQRAIDAFETHELDILVGTQMVAKGLDFPLVSLVGVIGAEAVGAAGDFRAGERLFQLLIQVAGRAGRAKTLGLVVVQSMTPRSPTVESAARQDFSAYAETELRARHHCGYPPFQRLIRWVISDRVQNVARSFGESLTLELRRISKDLNLDPERVYGPIPCAVERVAERYRYEVLVKAATSLEVESLMNRWREAEVPSSLRKAAIVDVDPVSLA